MKLPKLLGGKRRGMFFRLISIAIFQACAILVMAVLIRYTFDHFLNQSVLQWSSMVMTGTALIATSIISGWLQRNERILAEKLGQSYIHSLRRKLFKHVTRMDPQQLQKRRRGAVMLKFIGDLNALRRWISLGIVRMIVSGAMVTSMLIVLFNIDVILTLVAAVIIVFGTFANARVGKRLRFAAIEVRKHRARLSANINEKVSQMAVVQVFGRSPKEINRVRRLSHRLRMKIVDRSAKIGLIRGINFGVTAAMTTAVLMTGVLRVNTGHTTPGTIAAAIAVLGFLVPALRNLGRIYEYYQEAAVAREKILDFLKIRTTIKQGNRLPELTDGPGHLVFENISIVLKMFQLF